MNTDSTFKNIDQEIIQKLISLTKQKDEKISLKTHGVDYITHITIFTFIIPIILWIMVSLSNIIMRIIVPNYPDSIKNYSEQLFFLYIHLLLIIVSISLLREYFQPIIKNDHFAAAIFGLVGPIIVIFAGDFAKVLKH